MANALTALGAAGRGDRDGGGREGRVGSRTHRTALALYSVILLNGNYYTIWK